jgi:murein DD-endopeptidase MepM/ murein hydrolase activator NlpD
MIELERLRGRIRALFRERHLYVRSGGEMRAYVLSPRKQAIAAAVMGGAALWMGVCTAAMLVGLVAPTETAEATAGSPNPATLAALVERRHAALALLLADLKGAPGAAQALTPPIAQAVRTAAAADSPAEQLETVAVGQEQVLEAADAFARARGERLRRALKLAGIAPPGNHDEARMAGALGGPLIETDDPRALADVLGVDSDFAQRVRTAAANVSAAQALGERAERLPLALPTRQGGQSSGFGVRVDPFTRRPAFHPGLDFPGARMTPVYATAPGVVSFTGLRAGYGRLVEVDHGQGVKTRYAHLARITVKPGQRVVVGAALGGMGSTGRSTGTHLHYEVWVGGRPQDPARFVRAGAYVLQGVG